MPSVDFIDVRIVVDGTPLTEYPDPEAGVGERCSMTCYIEAKTDQSFGIQLRLLPGFDFRSASFLGLTYGLDNDKVGWGSWIPVHETSHDNGVLCAEKAYLVSDVRMKEGITGKWKRHHFVFGVLETNESAPMDSPNAMELENVGSIRVSVYRAKRTELSTPRVRNGHMPEVLDKISEKALKGKSLKNNVKYRTHGAPMEPPKPKKYKFEPVKGEAGQSYRFKFLYRSRRILQSMGCIALTPSPPPHTNPVLERTEEMLRQEKLENSRLRALLAEATSRSPSSRHVDSGPATPRVPGPSGRTRANSQESSIIGECDVQVVDMTNNSSKDEPELPFIDLKNAPLKRQGSILSDATVKVQRQRIAPPLFDSPSQSSKRAREDSEEVQILIPSDGPLTTSARTSSNVIKGQAKSEAADDKGQGLVKLCPQAKRLKAFEVIDLTDD